jgi:hypothetical protein
MIQRVVQSSGLDIFAQIGLIAFIIAFVLVLIWVFLLDDDEADRRANIPLSDEPGDAADGQDSAGNDERNEDAT